MRRFSLSLTISILLHLTLIFLFISFFSGIKAKKQSSKINISQITIKKIPKERAIKKESFLPAIKKKEPKIVKKDILKPQKKPKKVIKKKSIKRAKKSSKNTNKKYPYKAKNSLKKLYKKQKAKRVSQNSNSTYIHKPQFDTSKILKAINQEKFYPIMAKRRRIEGVVVVKFTLYQNGSIKILNISNAHPILQKASREIVLKASRYFPKPITSITISAPIEFKLRY